MAVCVWPPPAPAPPPPPPAQAGGQHGQPSRRFVPKLPDGRKSGARHECGSRPQLVGISHPGGLGIAVGLPTLVLAAAWMLVLVLLFAACMLVDGVFAIMAALRAARELERWSLLVLEGG